MNRPTENFYFQEEINFWFYDKEDFYKSIIDIENYVKDKKYDVIPNKIRKLYEKIIASIIEKKQIIIHQKDIKNNNGPSLANKNFAIKSTLSLDEEALCSMMFIVNVCNKYSHGDHKINDNIDDFEVISLLKNFYIFIISILNYENVNDSLLKEKEFLNNYLEINEQKIISEFENKIYQNKSSQFLPDISASEINILNFLFKSNRTFSIPIYQRGYSWTEENIEDLLNDIKSRIDDGTSHYFGVVAGKYIEDKEITQDLDKDIIKCKVIKIIDGQQRLTTSVLIVMACYYVLKELKYQELDNSFKEIFECLGGDKKYFYKLFSNPAGYSEENDSFKNILKRKWKPNELTSNYEKKLFFIINWIKDFSNEDTSKIEEFKNCFLSYFTIAMVDFNKDRIKIKKELEIFENLNSKGKNLTSSELIKNYIFNLCDDNTLEKENNKIKEYFEQKIVGEIRRYVSSRKEESYKVLDEYYSFITNYFKGKETKNKQNVNNVLKDFKDNVIKNILENLEIKKDFLFLEDYKKVIDKLHEFLIKGFIPIKFGWFDDDFYAKDLLSSLQHAKKAPIYSLSFLLSETYNEFSDLNKKEKMFFYESYKHLLKIMILHFLKYGQGNSDFRRNIFSKINLIKNKFKKITKEDIPKIFNLIKEEINLKNDVFKLHISKEELGELIIKIKSDNWVSRILLLLISYKMMPKEVDPQSFNKKISLEHILPVNISDKWIEDLREWNSINMTQMSDEYLKLECDKYINQIGNYVLIPNDLNSKLQNRSFVIKKELLSKQNFKSNLFQNENENIDILHKEKWSFKEIEKRSNELKNYALSIFEFN